MRVKFFKHCLETDAPCRFFCSHQDLFERSSCLTRIRNLFAVQGGVTRPNTSRLGSSSPVSLAIMLPGKGCPAYWIKKIGTAQSSHTARPKRSPCPAHGFG